MKCYFQSIISAFQKRHNPIVQLDRFETDANLESLLNNKRKSKKPIGLSSLTISVDENNLSKRFSNAELFNVDVSADKEGKEKQTMAREVLMSRFKSLPVLNIKHQSHFNITSTNIYDYELPPGLVTLREAKAIIELYRLGGRLVPHSVQKLIRLSYKLLKKRPNVTNVTIAPGEKLTVVGDLHGTTQDMLIILLIYS